MESTRATLNLSIPVSERSCTSPPLSHCPFKAHLKHQGRLTSTCLEEGPVGTAKQGQSRDIQQSVGRLPDAFPKSPRLQIPRKRRRRVEGLGGFEHNLKITPGTPQAPPKARRLTKLQITSPPTFGEWDLEENKPVVCTPAAWRNRGMGKERNKCAQELKPAWRVHLSDAFTANVHESFSKNRKDVSVKEERALPDSDTDLSEYDNDISPSRKQEDNFRNTQKAQQAVRDTDEIKKAGDTEKKSSQWRYEETEKKAAERRVMGKIEEVEGIIRRVSLTSSDWIKEGSEEKDGDVVEMQNKGCSEGKPQLVEELRALGEALSQSLRQALKMEAAKTERPITEEKNTSHDANDRRPLTICSQSFSSTARHASPSPRLSVASDESARRTLSSGSEGMSPLLSPLCTPLAHLHEQDFSERHIRWRSSVEDSVFNQGAGRCGTPVFDGRGNNEMKKRRKKARLNEQNQTSEAGKYDHLFSEEALQRQDRIWGSGRWRSLSPPAGLSLIPSDPNTSTSCASPPLKDDIF
ncbi:hypothetical protein KUCAC02_019986 [Chaenocephalus aceratus]|uniref:Uncharacterized protein n=1 Tax=Chaenocephalus aceratus TaxID=36190 RepID=A0ACB9VQ62_CHAAC|nr:hypothetical protein KUCAC02_019986 [Chaenocephalus aceratus]